TIRNISEDNAYCKYLLTAGSDSRSLEGVDVMSRHVEAIDPRSPMRTTETVGRAGPTDYPALSGDRGPISAIGRMHPQTMGGRIL
ncbi:hypothetical protein, partial [Aurantimonas sp. C2-4-R8]|nr:hypothetical protein [Aurantimonas sp. C2-4-R8]